MEIVLLYIILSTLINLGFALYCCENVYPVSVWDLCDLLAVLAGVYGDVHRVKILFNKKDNALIQMAEPSQAQLGELFHQLHIPLQNSC